MASRVDVAVIGAGPAGLAAAIAAREQGAEKVLIIERAEQLGGLLPQCIHNGFGLLYFEQDMTGPEYEKAFIAKAMSLGVETRLETMVIDLDAERGITAVSRKHGYMRFKPGAVVLAMGCRERSRGAVGIPGTRPAGVLTAGTCQRFVNIEGYMPGTRYVVLGSGDIGMIMARRLTLEGAKVEAVVEIMPWPGGLIRNEVQCLHDFGIPLLLESTVTFIHGEERVEGVTVCRVDAERRPVEGTEKSYPCDCLLVSAGLIPENELSRKAGVELDPVTGGPVVDQNRQTSVPGVFAGGNVVQVHDLVDWVSWEAEAAGRAAARFADKGELKAAAGVRVMPGDNIKYVVPHTISGREDVTLHMRVTQPGLKATVKAGGILSKRFRSVRPSEMVVLDLKGEALKEAGLKGELVVDCEMRGGG
ncbi:MAG: FAD-dependent oxidoreductase [Actinobacteria bacterium]|jgi:thioredoxin reductase|nr:MAG: FAD-dependent oxidoreductase [Actinomycetota bacterium]